jgi:branched-subunit amino acid ABC-type transport system permease component
MDCSPADDCEEIAIDTANDPVFTPEQIGWRFALGTLVLVGAYAAWPLIPVVMMTDLEPGIKAGLSGLLGATPFMSKFVALAIMGRPAYYFLKRTVFSRFRRRAPAQPAE